VIRVVRFGWGALEELPATAEEVGVERPLLVSTRRGSEQARGLSFAGVFDGVRSHVPAETVDAAVHAVEDAGADGLVALGGGSAIDTAKAVTLELVHRGRSVRTIAVPTTYAGAEWTPYFGVRDEASRTKRGGSDERARPVAAIYDPALTIGLPRGESVGTAMNALAHAAEALYTPGPSTTDAHAAARAISDALPRVAADGDDREARTQLLEGAMHAGFALADGGMALAHAIAQALGGRYGIPHGAANAVSLAPALRFNEPAVPEALAELADAMQVDDPIARVEELARLGGYARLRDLGVPEDELEVVAELAAARPAARANPRSASSAEIAQLLRSVW
jgi:alcohol dehydrogenase class IV